MPVMHISAVWNANGVSTSQCAEVAMTVPNIPTTKQATRIVVIRIG